MSESTDGSVGIDSSEVSKSTVVLHDNNIKTLYTRKKNKTPIPKGLASLMVSVNGLRETDTDALMLTLRILLMPPLLVTIGM